MQVDSTPAPEQLTRRPSHASARPPKGILKHSSSSSGPTAPSLDSLALQTPPATGTAQGGGGGIAWDEANLSLNEVNKDSTMKITEPKTPYVRYNAETDEVMDLDKIPGFSLGSTSFAASPPGSAASPTSTGGFGSRRGSEASEKMVRVERSDSFGSTRGGGAAAATGDEMAVEEDSDDEVADEETLEHRKQFAQQRGRHYSNEAEAMKRAAALLAQEDEDDDDEEAEGPEEMEEEERVEANTEANAHAGLGGSAGREGGARVRGGGGVVPPVPPIPNGLRQ
ncbi:hypothetical protein JCM8547_002336 [Rhodosporidiobolus lusitaniae]